MGLRGLDITLNAARVVLIHDNIQVLPYTLSLSKKTLRVIRLNLYLAASIHIVAAGLSAAGLIGILGSALFHQASSLIVLLNTLRLFSAKLVEPPVEART